MKYCMKTLHHNGIYIPPFDYKGLSVTILGQTFKLSPRTEQMATAWIRKRQSLTSPPDKVFYKNFIQDFLEALKNENSSDSFLPDFAANYLKDIDSDDTWLTGAKPGQDPPIDFSEVTNHVVAEQQRKLGMSKEEKKRIAAERKVQREALREKYGHAVVDDKTLEIANWTAEPSCIFVGRGNHPKRGKWKEGPNQEDIILNLSNDTLKPIGWKDVVWEPEKMYVAKWEDMLSGKIKYVWFSDSAFLKQKMEKEKFKKAEKLEREIPKVAAHIMQSLDFDEAEKRKIATVCWLILEVNIRVGDEKDPGEADTVGAITLRPEHIRIEENTVHFDFLGKDAVRWVKDVEAPPAVIRNIQQFAKECKEYLFEGINSKKVSRFLSQKMEGLTAKVFRTWRCTGIVKQSLKKCGAKKDDADYFKQFCAKMANLEAAKAANHKRKIPPNFDERVARKEARLKELEQRLKEKSEQGKKTDAAAKSVEKAKLDMVLTRETREYNLGTSLKSYIDPSAYVTWASRVQFPLEKFYPKNLRKKYSWALGEKCANS